MKLAYIIPACAWLVASSIAYQAVAFVQPLPNQELKQVRGGQITCLVQTGVACPEGSGPCTNGKCTIQPDNTINCPYPSQSISGTGFSTCPPGTGPEATQTCTQSGYQCIVKTSCSGGCAPVQGQGAALFCSTGGSPTYPNPESQSDSDGITCPASFGPGDPGNPGQPGNP